MQASKCRTVNGNKPAKPKSKAHPSRKTAERGKPHEIWEGGGWRWELIKRYAEPAKDGAPYQRWMCRVTSPMSPSGDLGDVYVSEIKSAAIRTHLREDY